MPALIPALFVSAGTSPGIFVLGGAVRKRRRGFEILPELPVSLTQEGPLVPLPIMPRFITVHLGHTHSPSAILLFSVQTKLIIPVDDFVSRRKHGRIVQKKSLRSCCPLFLICPRTSRCWRLGQSTSGQRKLEKKAWAHGCN